MLIFKEPQKIKISLAIGFCTFKREEYITCNLRELEKSFEDINENNFSKNLQVYVADNGQSLNPKDFNEDFIHIYPNKNYGGAGGFTRTIIESMINIKSNDYIILMDDDLILDTRILERTYRFLSVLKTDYYDSMLGGAILSQQEPWLQVENGAYCDKYAVRHKVHGLMDMRNVKNVLINQTEGGANYNGWFFCAIPKTVIREDNLPLPIFIHYDDTDYGHRNESNQLITLGGICIWHPNLLGKDPLWMNYYNQRNQLIHLVWCNPNIKVEIIWKCFYKKAYYLLQHCQYDAVLLLCRGIEDFYRGPNAFKDIDPQKLHMELIKNRYEKTPVSKQSVELFKFLNKVCKVLHFRIFKSYLYDKTERNAVVFRYNKDRKEECIRRIKKIKEFVYDNHDYMWPDWITAYREICNIKFWNQYLQLY